MNPGEFTHHLMKKILILEGNKDLLEVIQIALQKVDYMVLGLLDMAKVFSTLAEFRPHLLMMGVNRKSASSKDLLHKIIASYPTLPIIAISGNPKIQSVFKKLGFAAFLSMPFSLEELYHTIDQAFARQVANHV